MNCKNSIVYDDAIFYLKFIIFTENLTNQNLNMENCGCPQVVCDDEITLNPCVEGFTLYLNGVDNSYLVYITINESTYVVQSQLVNKRMFVAFKPIEYVTQGILEVRVKTLQGESVEIPFGDTCNPQCGFTISLGQINNETFLNKKCASIESKCFTIPINNCPFNIPIKNCSYFL